MTAPLNADQILASLNKKQGRERFTWAFMAGLALVGFVLMIYGGLVW